MFEYLIKGFLLGLSLSGSCLTTCGPIYMPYLLLEKRTLFRNFKLVLEISIGRFITYAIFGALAGYLGKQFSDDFRFKATGISYLLLSIFLLLYLFSNKQINHSSCNIKKWYNRTKDYPIILGLITGISFCPSFLIALTGAFEKAGIVNGMLFFSSFFFGTTIVILPLAFIGLLPNINFNLLKKIGFVATLLVIIWFSFSGIKIIKESFFSLDTTISFLNTEKIYLISTDNEEKYIDNFKKTIEKDSKKAVILLDKDINILKIQISKLNPKSYILVTSETLAKNPEIESFFQKKMKENKLYILVIESPNQALTTDNYTSEIINKLDYFHFKVKDSGMYFKLY